MTQRKRLRRHSSEERGPRPDLPPDRSARAGAAVRSCLRRIPVTIALLLVTLVANAVTGAALRAPGPRLRDRLGLGAEQLILGHRVVSLVTSVVLTDGPAQLVVVLAALLAVVGAAEHRMGHRRVLLSWIVTAVGGGLVGTAAQAAGLLTRGVWSTPPADLMAFHPSTPIIGSAMAASAFAGPLWCRRIRVLGFAGLIVALLYSGQPGDVYRLAGALVGLGLGLVLARNRPRLDWPRGSHHETRALLAVLVAVDAVGPLVAVVHRTGYGLLRPLGRLFADPLPRSAEARQVCLHGHAAACGRLAPIGGSGSAGTIVLDVLPLVVLLIVAVGIWHGRRAAAWGAVLVNVALGALAAVYYDLLPVLHEPEGIAHRASREPLTLQTLLAALLPLAIALAVGLNLEHLTVRTRKRVVVASAAAVLAVVLGGATAYIAVGSIAPEAFAPAATPGPLVTNAVDRFVPIGFLPPGRLDLAAVAPMTRLLSDWIGAAGWIALAAAVAACCLAVSRPRLPAEEARVRRILRQGAPGSISHMATWTGNRYWFSADGRHAVAYRERSGVAVTLGEPIGPADGAIDAARAFVIACDDRAVTPAFYAVRRTFADAIGGGFTWSSTGIGEDTVLDPVAFTMKGRQWQDVRSSLNRAGRLGIRAVWTRWDALSVGHRAQIEAISAEWIADQRLPELGFTVGGLRELQDRDVQLMLAVGPEGRIEAVTSWLPSWRSGAPTGLTLDVMRRRPAAMNGVIEFLIASVVVHAQQRELEFVSLSVAPLSLTATDDPDRMRQLLGFVGRVLEPAYGFASLAAFKAKFEPEHVPVVIAYPDAVSLPAIGVAVARSYLPGLGVGDLARLAHALRPTAHRPRRRRRARPPAITRQADRAGAPAASPSRP